MSSLLLPILWCWCSQGFQFYFLFYDTTGQPANLFLQKFSFLQHNPSFIMEGEIRQLFHEWLLAGTVSGGYFAFSLMIGLEFIFLCKMIHTFAYWKNASRAFENSLPPNEREHLLSIKCEKVNFSGIFLILMPAMTETWVWSLGWENLLETWKATHSSILAWRIPGTV